VHVTRINSTGQEGDERIRDEDICSRKGYKGYAEQKQALSDVSNTQYNPCRIPENAINSLKKKNARPGIASRSSTAYPGKSLASYSLLLPSAHKHTHSYNIQATNNTFATGGGKREIEYTGSIAKVGRQGKELPNGLGNG